MFFIPCTLELIYDNGLYLVYKTVFYFKVERFRCHNGQWLSVVETLGAEGGTGDATDDLPPYLSAEYLTTHRLTTSGIR